MSILRTACPPSVLGPVSAPSEDLPQDPVGYQKIGIIDHNEKEV